MTERDFQRAVIDLARIGGWRVAHFRPAQTMHGWRTPVEADGAGFPDLVLVHPTGGVLFRELKSPTGRLSAAQAQWLLELQEAGADAAIWEPSQLQEIAERLTRRQVRSIA